MNAPKKNLGAQINNVRIELVEACQIALDQENHALLHSLTLVMNRVQELMPKDWKD